jgi:hypothetical protein
MLKDDNSLADQIPRIAVGRDGRFVVVWCALGAGIKGQRFSREGNMVGKLFSLSEKKTQNAQFPSVKIDNQNRIGVVWQQGSLDDFRILLRVLSWNLKPSRIVQVDNAHGTAYFSNPDILFLKNGRILVAWKDYRTGEANVFQQMFSPSVTPTGKNIQVNDDTGKQWQRLPRLLSAEGAQYALVWEDYRNDVNNQMADLYFQRYTQTGSRTGENRKVEVTQEPTSQRFPAGVMKLNGELILAWSDTRWNVSSVFVKQVPVHGQQMESETQVFP